jgi:CheY-like chemotaxis protein
MSQKSFETSFMVGQPLRVLMVEDSGSDAELCLHALERAGFAVRADIVTTAAEFSEKLGGQAYDIILADHLLPAWSGFEALELLKQSAKDIPFILVTGVLADDTALEFIEMGADDYILKDRMSRLPLAVRRVLREQRLLEERRRASVEREKLIVQLQEVAEEVKRLNGMLPICMSCKKILDARGRWHRIELYIQKHSRGQVSPCLCPECSKKTYPEYFGSKAPPARIAG